VQKSIPVQHSVWPSTHIGTKVKKAPNIVGFVSKHYLSPDLRLNWCLWV
jgi:hypothetical protein